MEQTKNVHVKLDRAVHTVFKSTLVMNDLSMQEAFDAFARWIAKGNPGSKRWLSRLVSNRVRTELATVGLKPLKHLNPRALNLNDETLYDLINEADGDDEDALPTAG